MLLVREWQNFRFSWPQIFLLLIFVSGIPYICFLTPIILNAPLGIVGDALALGTFSGVWSVSLSRSWTSRAFETEDSYILLSSAPVSLSHVGWCKRLAVLIPIWITSVPLILLTGITGRPWGWVIFFLFTAPLCQVVLRSWNTLPIPSFCAWEGLPYCGERGCDSGRDPQVLCWCELLSLCIWAVAPCLIFMGQTLWGLLALGLEVGLVAIAYRRILHIGDVWSD
jgi:hypothetical protein